MITTYDNVKLKPTKKVLNQMLNDYLEGEGGRIINSLSSYWDISKMTSNEKEIIVNYIIKERQIQQC
tara:strand:+ start:239 stop:439 length:201 start_codon:yes stop_codon:yes gene_type:complete